MLTKFNELFKRIIGESLKTPFIFESNDSPETKRSIWNFIKTWGLADEEDASAHQDAPVVLNGSRQLRLIFADMNDAN